MTVPKYGSELLEVDAVSNLSGLMQQFKNLQQDNIASVSYTLKGTVHLGAHNLRIPFERHGQIALPSISAN